MSKILGVHIPTPQNLAINGAMDFFQRIEGNTLAFSTASVGYVADMFVSQTAGTTTKSLTGLRSTTIPTQAQSGFQGNYSLQVTNNTAVPTLAAGDILTPMQYRMEGLDYAKIHGKTATFGFWYSPIVAGTFSFALRNQAATRSYVTTFAASLGFQFISITVPLDTTASSWNFDNTIGMFVEIGAVAGSTYQTSTLNSWQSGNYFMASTATNWAATTGSSYVTQFSIVEGSLGFGPTGFARSGKSIQQELTLCQRYYEKSYDIGTAPGTISGSGIIYNTVASTTALAALELTFKVNKRASATNTIWNPGVSNTTGSVYNYGTSASIAFVIQFGGTTGIAGNISSATGANTNIGAHFTADAGL